MSSFIDSKENPLIEIKNRVYRNSKSINYENMYTELTYGYEEDKIDYLSATGEDQTNWNYRIQLSDGYSEDFTFYPPYPNPSFGQTVSMNIQVITEQTIHANIYDLLGQKIWSSSKHFSSPETETLICNGKNKKGDRVSNGIYFIKLEGDKYQTTQKVIYLKK
mgnify:CR=1 FL=1